MDGVAVQGGVVSFLRLEGELVYEILVHFGGGESEHLVVLVIGADLVQDLRGALEEQQPFLPKL